MQNLALWQKDGVVQWETWLVSFGFLPKYPPSTFTCKAGRAGSAALLWFWLWKLGLQGQTAILLSAAGAEKGVRCTWNFGLACKRSHETTTDDKWNKKKKGMQINCTCLETFERLYSLIGNSFYNLVSFWKMSVNNDS